ncbi:MAG: D-alanyl-D-alanine carboxypeptidase [Peptococcaceae bacterium]|nr:D-alanyl-D-alanine carboxypeptidase [Peptococcaceae bacterium]
MFKKYILSCVVCLCLICGQIVPVGATPGNQQGGGQNGTKAFQPTLTADAAVLIDSNNGQILFDKQAHKRRPPASTTKIMTTILALEFGNLADVVTVSDHAAKVGESTIHLDPGEKLTLGSLIEGALIKSGNDACVAIAEQIAGSEEAFVQLMNAKARVLGAYDTNFVNTNGLPNKQHYSTAYDLALMARHGTHLAKFAEVTRIKETAIEFIQPHTTLPIRNTNKLLWMYEFADGVKTGTTNAAGKCLVASATKNGRQLIAVVLNSPARFQDAMKLLEYGFNNFQTVTRGAKGEPAGNFAVTNGTQPRVPVVLGSSVKFLANPKDKASVERTLVWTRGNAAPIKAGEVLGYAEYSLHGQVLGQASLAAANSVAQLSLWQRLNLIRQQELAE